MGDAFYLLGGSFHPEDGTREFYSDIWTSSNGTNWSLVTSAAPWTPRDTFGCVVLSNRIYIMGGNSATGTLNDVWSSANGIQWVAHGHAPWSPRRLFGAASFDGAMWVLGGDRENWDLTNDVWSSSTGEDWSLITNSAPWTARLGHSAVSHEGSLWVLGGAPNPEWSTNDTWATTNGSDWMLISASNAWPKMWGHSVASSAGGIWLVGGTPATGIAVSNTWRMDEIGDWTRMATGSWGGRWATALSADLRGRVILAGGSRGNGFAYQDVWTMKDPFGPPEALADVTALRIYRGISYSRPSELGAVYQLQGRASPFVTDWTVIGETIQGNGSAIHAFEVGDGPVFLPSRRWMTYPDTDGFALRFDGANDFTFTPHVDALNLSTGMTLEAWVKPDANRAANLLSKGDGPVALCYRLELDAGNRAALLLVSSDGSISVSATGVTTLATGVWHHVAATWDGTTSRVFLNGTEESSTNAAMALRAHGPSVLALGGGGTAQPFLGCMDQVRVWSRARSPAEIAADYGAMLAGNEPGLVGYWRFATNQGQLAADSGPLGIALTLGSLPTQDVHDPEWVDESFIYMPQTEDIFAFGNRCIVGGLVTRTGAMFRVETAHDATAGEWMLRHDWRKAVSNEYLFLIAPTNPAAILRGIATTNAPF